MFDNVTRIPSHFLTVSITDAVDDHVDDESGEDDGPAPPSVWRWRDEFRDARSRLSGCSGVSPAAELLLFLQLDVIGKILSKGVNWCYRYSIKWCNNHGSWILSLVLQSSQFTLNCLYLNQTFSAEYICQ